MSKEKSGKAKNSKTAPTRTAKEKKQAKAEKRRIKNNE
ncbi:hypothetical protein DFQ08_102873 [Winogradskyella arenosi]|uniref:Uncharacterized protein n=1 Tax=Winogradskyella arenosi TaxID=533325 RepID=A0A368ZJM4_9FLAO|nr:hypothetical protein DFQ08_102873 [Winogradskyella arenosi]